MPYITSVERIGYERGERTGYETGYEKGEKTGYKKGGIFVLARLIAKKFRSDMEYELNYLAGLNEDDISELGELILDMEFLDEVHNWIDKRGSKTQ